MPERPPTPEELADLGRRIQTARIERKWSQMKLAQEAGLSLNYTRSLEIGQRNPSIGVIAAIARALGVEVRELLADIFD